VNHKKEQEKASICSW